MLFSLFVDFAPRSARRPARPRRAPQGVCHNPTNQTHRLALRPAHDTSREAECGSFGATNCRVQQAGASGELSTRHPDSWAQAATLRRGERLEVPQGQVARLSPGIEVCQSAVDGWSFSSSAFSPSISSAPSSSPSSLSRSTQGGRGARGKITGERFKQLVSFFAPNRKLTRSKRGKIQDRSARPSLKSATAGA